MGKPEDRHVDYYEAIIQLRPPTEEIIAFIKNQCKKRKEAITKIVTLKTGIDLYITSQKFARTLGAKLKRNFGGELKITKKIHTKDRQTSKDIYRATILFRPKSKGL
ncbi:MAG: 60S ribosomal export protein NMD3 [Nanoarchaeota archaeon]|nr:60S ribosomal export protein NMD3 [Nanoarchaeota archaeon]